MAQIEMHIAKPCNQTWTAMKGDEQVRHCQVCRKSVYNISEMTAAEVEELIRRTDGKFCARLYRRTDNRVMTKDCPKGVALVRRKRVLVLSAACAAVAYGGQLVLEATVMGTVKTKRLWLSPTQSIDRSKAVDPDLDRTEESNATMGKMVVSPRALK